MRKSIDAPLVPIFFGLGAIILIVLACLPPFRLSPGFFLQIIAGLFLGACGLRFLQTSIAGKGKIWDTLLHKVAIDPAAQCLDVGCGNGLVMFKLAAYVPHGQILGIDIWRAKDQSHNSQANLETAIATKNLSHLLQVQTADMRQMPFEANSFDLITASLAIHNIKSQAQRRKALQEITRVLKDTGELLIVDMAYKDKEYLGILKDLGFNHFTTYSAGHDGWWGGPWAPSFVLTAAR
ncbi:class I SAM-dependent methyltransferase [Agrilactobacillus composti]|uniref:class I SAM-dependent methyltransferase n=1 Tax=Agrilactobacillus composti TaxID=398555 RepID=UPI000553EA90|nr:class I SAM-dependent methyltransferase [Agrilactobacillus composti]